MSQEQASILTEAQRQYLNDGTNLSGDPVSNPYEYDKNIKKRLARILLDLSILYENLEQEDLRDVFAEGIAELQEAESNEQGETSLWYCNDCGEYTESVNHNCSGKQYDPHWYAAAPSAFAFFVWALNINDEPIYPPYDKPQPAFERLEEALEKGMAKYLSDKQNLVANVSISIDLEDVDRIEELYDNE